MPFTHCPPVPFNLAEAIDYNWRGRSSLSLHSSWLRVTKWREHNTKQPKHCSPLRQRAVKTLHQMFLLHLGSLNYCFNEDLFVVLLARCHEENSANYFDLIQRTAGYPLPTLTWITEMQTCLSGRGEAHGRGRWGEKRCSRIDPSLASARLFHGVVLNIKSVTFPLGLIRKKQKTLFHCISRRIVCTMTNCFPLCDVLCTLVILCHWIFFFPLSVLNSEQFASTNQPPNTVNNKKKCWSTNRSSRSYLKDERRVNQQNWGSMRTRIWNHRRRQESLAQVC